MTSTALNNLWAYIDSISLSDRNKQWLADKLIESKKKSKKEAQAQYVRESLQRALDEVKEMKKKNYEGVQTMDEFLAELD